MPMIEAGARVPLSFATYCPKGFRFGLQMPDIGSKDQARDFARCVLGVAKEDVGKIAMVAGHMAHNFRDYNPQGWMAFLPLDLERWKAEEFRRP